MTKDFFLTASQESGPLEFREKASKFISYLFLVNCRYAAEKKISEIRKKYHDASHVVFAFRIGKGVEEDFRFSDDGEPSGTGGKPLYESIVKTGIFNVCVCSVRYFGGVKLGTGGLSRAYRQSADMAVKVAGVKKIFLKEEISFMVDFSCLGNAEVFIEQKNIDCVRREYIETGVIMCIRVPRSAVLFFKEHLSEALSGNIRFL